MQVQVSDEAKNAAQWNLSLPQAVVKPDLFQTVSYDPTKLRNKKYTPTLNPAMKYVQSCVLAVLHAFNSSHEVNDSRVMKLAVINFFFCPFYGFPVFQSFVIGHQYITRYRFVKKLNVHLVVVVRRLH